MPVYDVLSDADFVKLFYATGDLAIVCDFQALWCGPCRQMAPIFDQLQKQYRDVIFARINCDVCPETVRRYNVSALPTFVFIINSQEIGRFSGYNPEELTRRVEDLNSRVAPGDRKSTRSANAANTFERQWLSHFVTYADRMFEYGEEVAQMQALSLIPAERLRAEATLNGAIDDVKLVDSLARWFKGEFFEWVNKPKCPTCGTDAAVNEVGSVEPRPEETEGKAFRVECYVCGMCNGQVRFPRYNDPVKLLETRKGRCGEWANCFALCCFAMGLETRFVVDRSDHVWVEIWSKRLDRWVHCDPCEAIVDTPLLYEKGWGKQLAYVLSVGADDVRDVTWRYTFDHKAVLRRRQHVRENVLANFISKLRNRQRTKSKPNASRQDELLRRRIREVVELMNPKLQLRENAEQQQGRVSGDAEWTHARGEDGSNVRGSCQTKTSGVLIRPTEDDVSNKIFTVNYNVANDSYSNQITGFASQAFKVDGVFRKVEHDWNKVYLAREEGRDTGEITWRIDLMGLPVDDVEIDLKGMTTFESGHITATACCGDFCVRIPEDTGKAVMKGVGSADHVDINVSFGGGNGAVAWQHAQLFRSHINDSTPCMSVVVRFNGHADCTQASPMETDSFVIRPTEDDVSNKVFTLSYSVTDDKYTNNVSEYQHEIGTYVGFESQAFKVDGVFRKVEYDWDKVYLAREEGRERGEIAWRIDLKGLPVDEVEIDLKGMTTFENGSITAIACCGDFCVRIPEDTGKAVMKGVGSADHVDITVSFEGGNGAVAWQHAQLFRSDRSDSNADMKVVVRFK
ncbi:hypothetical protein QR680_008221 [Steinernema hermaphroditum]|uniref:Peptide-N(4)-(N-acetyl-beta-glucosaminyl)asparagine amidase n=1 Tax=Steinernema hermaphroditum TaxID=289476 RepID=A0AA39IFU1_9BILA|nr:hypothetical protein QR680_008221 [Steinernema hermaphroditum]